MVKRVEAFKANDGTLYETEKDAKLSDLIDVICKEHPVRLELIHLLNIALKLNRDALIMQIEKDWVLTKPTLAVRCNRWVTSCPVFLPSDFTLRCMIASKGFSCYV